MDEIARIVVTAFPWLVGVVDVARVVVTALPQFFGELIDTARVVVTATPYLGIPIWLYGLIGGGFLTWAWSEIG